MNRADLIQEIKNKKSFLCIGLDTDIQRIPAHLKHLEDPIFEFNKKIIDATHSYCIAYKPNLAFYESLGAKGWESLKKTLDYIPKNIFTIADAKRGDIGNTSKLYAQAFFEHMNFDSITVAPYMGKDSITPFLEFKNKWVILLANTSNEGASDFQALELINGIKLFEQVLTTSQTWGNINNLMYVVGATRGEAFSNIRKIVPDHFLLVPGIGAQGGSLDEVVKFGMNKDCGLIVNSSRAIIYASSGVDFAEKAQVEAQKIQLEMQQYLEHFQLI